MRTNAQTIYADKLAEIRRNHLLKSERLLGSPQRAKPTLADGRPMLNLCANNYLGLADHPLVIQAAKDALDRWGFGMASVRFICGTQTLHRQLEEELSRFLGTQDTILYSSCFDANGGLFETLLEECDAVISDELNHASIIDGIRLCKAKRHRYRHSDMADLESQLRAAQEAGTRLRMIATDGVFSMDGDLAKLPEICDLAERYQAMVMVDDSHAVGFIGPTGRGTPEHFGVQQQIDVYSGTLGKALGGASGGYVSASQEIIDLLRQRSRPYLFSNSLAPCVMAGSLMALKWIDRSDELRRNLRDNIATFRQGMKSIGFTLSGDESGIGGAGAICPVMLGDAGAAQKLAQAMMDRGVYVVAFSYPVVPQGKARIRTQLSAAHTRDDLQMAMAAFAEAKKACQL